ncbi:MAG: metallophosphoesterase [Myxococcota bacterium]
MTGRTFVIGDVHGCSRELSRLLRKTRADRTILVGDLFTKGPDPQGVLSLVREHDLEFVLGNHDQRLIDVANGDRPRDPHGRKVAAALTEVEPHWCGWLEGQPLFLEADGWTVVHAALHPTGRLAQTTRRTAQFLRRWPDDARTDPRWWTVYEGERPVVFGHDARQGLLFARRDRVGRPRVVGLDTGCVYGGQLTGMWLDDCAIVQVRAERAYKPIG